MSGALLDSIRVWRRTPGVALVAAASLALAIGAATTFVSIADQLLLRTLPVERPDDLFLLSDDVQAGRQMAIRARAALWQEIKSRSHLYASAFAWMPWQVNLAPAGEAQPAFAIWASGDAFATLGLTAVRGRLFGATDDVVGGGPDGHVAVVSHAFWTGRLAGDPAVVGRVLRVEDVPFTIIGVVEPAFSGFEVGVPFDLVLPFAAQPAVLGGLANGYRITMRLADRPAHEVEAALRADQAAIGAATRPGGGRARDRENYLQSPFRLLPAANGGSSAARVFRRGVAVALGLALLVVVAACGNVGALMLAHGEARRPDLAVHVALGASGRSVAGRLLSDSLVLAVAGAGAGLGLAWFAVPWVLAQMSAVGVDVRLDTPVDWRAAAAAVLLALGTAAACGLAPAVAAVRLDPVATLKASGPGHSRRQDRLRGLVGVQVAFSMAVVVVGSLLLANYQRLARTQSGIDAPGLVVVEMPLDKVGDAARATRDVLAMREAAARLPGVQIAAVAATVPPQGFVMTTIVEPSGLESLPEPDRTVHFDWVSPGYFAAFGTPLLAGRDFGDADEPGAPLAGIVNRAFAGKYFSGRLATPASLVRLLADGSREDITVVGIVEDATFTAFGEPAEPTLYVAAAQQPDLLEPVRRANLVVRPLPGARIPSALSTVLANAAPAMRFRTVAFSTYIRGNTALVRVVALAGGFFLLVATLLAVAGVAGMTAYAVARERRDLAIRMALGAPRRRIGQLVAGRTCAVVAAGMVAGAGTSAWAARLLGSLPFFVPEGDPWTFASAACLMVVATAIAAAVPVLTAMRIDSAETLRTV